MNLPIPNQLEREQTSETRTCFFCGSEEGTIRKIGQYEISLRKVTFDDNLHLACQGCAHKIVQYPLVKQKGRHTTSLLTKFFSTVIATCFIVVVLASAASAQPPGFPKAADQAPIDGGLSLLAAAGGAYAVKKLRDKQENDEH